MNNPKNHFPALDGLRFAAFLLVYVHHITFYQWQDYSTNGLLVFFRKNGWIGVDIFFILTGFLITVGLLNECSKTGRIQLIQFYLRRIARIWPLYFLAIVTGYGILPFLIQAIIQKPYIQPSHWQYVSNTLPWFAFFAGNWYTALFGWGDSRSVSQLWAISLDQQFYIIWPLILRSVSGFRRLVTVSIVGVLIAVGVRMFLVSITAPHPSVYTNTFARWDTFMAGALLAIMYQYKQTVFEKIATYRTSMLQYIGCTFLLIFLYISTLHDGNSIRNGIWGYLVVDVLLTYVMLTLIAGSTALSNVLRWDPIAKLGVISYGLYVWHIPILEIIYSLMPVGSPDILVPLFSLPITIGLARFSYIYFEKPFARIIRGT